MVHLHSLIKIRQRGAKRRGRGLGSGSGSKSGRGTTRHQKARTSIPLHFEGGQGRLVKKYPLLRGKSQNNSIQSKPFTLRLSRLMHIEHEGAITLAILIEKSIVPRGTLGVKVVYDKEVSKPLTLQLLVSAKVAKAVTDAGGSIVS
jgi:large subunit ribosomal protein L15